MTDREKVIKALQQCVGYEDADNKYTCIYDSDTNPNCPYGGTGDYEVSCMTKMMQDALTLLKAQEPRVMTLEEFNAHWQIPPQERKPIWEEWKVDNGKGKWKLYGRATGGYGDMWRCWTSRPTDEQRQAVKWE